MGSGRPFLSSRWFYVSLHTHAIDTIILLSGNLGETRSSVWCTKKQNYVEIPLPFLIISFEEVIYFLITSNETSLRCLFYASIGAYGLK